MRSFFKFLSLPKSSFIASSIGVVVTIARAIGKLAVGFDDIGASAVVVVELGVSTVGSGVPSLGMLTGNGWTFTVPLGLGFPQVLR